MLIVQNVKFMYCGVNVTSAKNASSCSFTATISLLNVQSIVLSNITFENSLGHGIVGINVLGSSTLVNITVYHNNNLSTGRNNSLREIGGIMLIYVDTMGLNQTESKNSILIQNCIICCMSEQSGSEKLIMKITQVKVILGVLIYQRNFSINVRIKNRKILFQSTRLVYCMYRSHVKNSISIYNSSFTYCISQVMRFCSVA